MARAIRRLTGNTMDRQAVLEYVLRRVNLSPPSDLSQLTGQERGALIEYMQRQFGRYPPSTGAPTRTMPPIATPQMDRLSQQPILGSSTGLPLENRPQPEPPLPQSFRQKGWSLLGGDMAPSTALGILGKEPPPPAAVPTPEPAAPGEALPKLNITQRVKDYLASKLAGAKETIGQYAPAVEEGGEEPTPPEPPEELEPQTESKSVEESVKEYLRRKQMARAGEKTARYGSQLGRGFVGLAGIDTSKFERPEPSRELEEIEDTLPPDVLASIKEATGIDLPEGITWTQLRSTLPSVAGVMQSRISQEARAEEAEWRRGMAEDRAELNAMRAGQISPTAERDLTTLNVALRNLQDLDKAEKELKDSYGPILTRWNQLLQKVGWDDPSRSEFVARATDLFMKYLYGTAGRQLAVREIEWMKQTFFQATMAPTTFRELMKSVKQRLESNREELLRVQANQGRNIKPHLPAGWDITFDEAGRAQFIKPEGEASEAASEMIEVEVDGERHPIHISQWDAFKEMYPNAIRVGE